NPEVIHAAADDGALGGGDVTPATYKAAAAGLSFQSQSARECLGIAGLQCDGVISVIDVVKFVNVVFRGGDAGVEFCDPCVP
ncbi:MAG TPA: hypothetical protein VM118_02065, partial [Acidobacteriota bacterium]|nr:hypothetical protein [Acidobacteriota bacterium]